MISQEAFFGGSRDATYTANATIFCSLHRVQIIRCTVPGLTIKLQGARQLKTGGPFGFVVNAGPEDFTLADNGGGTLKVMAPNDCAEISLLSNATTAGKWVLASGIAGFVNDPPITLHMFIFGGASVNLGGFSGVVSTTRKYDPQLETWALMTAMPAFESGHVIGVSTFVPYGTKAYGTGMNSGVSSGGFFGHQRMMEYEPDAWTHGTDSTMYARNAGGGALGAFLYFFNGIFTTGSGFSEAFQRQTFEYSVSGAAWATKTTRPSSRAISYSTPCNANSKLVLPQGLSGGSSNAVDTYVGTTDTWTAKTTRPGPSAPSCAAANVDDTVYVYGGDSASAILSTAYSYDEAADAWTALLNMPVGRHFHGCGTVGQFTYLMGGYGAHGVATSGAVDTNYEHSVAGDTYLAKPSIIVDAGTGTGKVNGIMNQTRPLSP